MFLYRSKRQVHTYTNLEKAIQFIYLSENVHVQVHDVPGDGNCLYHCLFFLYRKYINIKKKDEILPVTNGKHANLRLHVANQLVIGDVKDALKNICLDLFIDDGGHTNRMQENTMKDIWKSVRPGGYLIMEDLHTSYRGSALKNNHIVLKPPNHTTLQLITNLVDGHFDVIDESWSTLFSDLNVEHSTCGVRVTFYGDSIPRRTVTSLLKKKCNA